MKAHSLEVRPVNEGMKRQSEYTVAAHTVHQWLDSNLYTADKPIGQILQEKYKGWFVFGTRDGEVRPGPLAYVSQLSYEDTNIHEISSFIVDPAVRGQGIGSRLLAGYTYDLQADTFPGSDLVAVTHPTAVGFFEAIGFEQIDPAEVDGLPEEFKQRAQQLGKIPVLRSLENLPPPPEDLL